MLTVLLLHDIVSVNNGEYVSCTSVAGPEYVYQTPAAVPVCGMVTSVAPPWLIMALIEHPVDAPVNKYWK